MASVASILTVRVLPPSNLPPSGTPFLVFTPALVALEPGKSQIVTIQINDGTGKVVNPAGVIVPFWIGMNNAISATVIASNQIKIDVPLTSGMGDYFLNIEIR